MEDKADKGVAGKAGVFVGVDAGQLVAPALHEGVQILLDAVDLIGVFSAELCSVEGGVGVVEEFGVVAAVEGGDGRAHGAGNVQVGHLGLQQGAEGGDEHPAAVMEQLLVGDVVEEHQELVAADAPDDIVGAEEPLEVGTHLGQDGIAVQVAAAVIDGFEVVQIQHQQGGEGLGILGGQVGGDQLLGGGLVEQGGQRVPLCLLLQVLFGLLEVVDIGNQTHDAAEAAVGVVLGHGADLVPQVAALAVCQTHLKAHGAAAAAQNGELAAHEGQIVGVEAGGRAKVGAVSLGTGGVAPQGPAVFRAAEGVRPGIPFEDHRIGLVQHQLGALQVGLKALLLFLDQAVVTDGVVDVLLSVRLQVGPALGEHPHGGAVLAQQTVFRFPVAALGGNVLHGPGEGLPVFGEHQVQILPIKKLLNFFRRIPGEGVQLSGTGIDGHGPVGAAAQGAAHQTV